MDKVASGQQSVSVPTSSANTSAATSATASPSQSSQNAQSTPAKPIDLDKIYTWINELCMPSSRENALLELSRQREAVADLAPFLWHSFGSIASLLQEVISVYPAINPPTLTVGEI